MTLAMRLYVLNYSLLQKPLDFSAINGITRQAVNFPANNSLRFARLYFFHHFIKDRATGNFCRSLFYKFFSDMKIFPLCQFSQFGELSFNREDLFVLNISRFASVKKIFKHGCILPQRMA